jgi:membrane protein implicated in regulation of membrane protease activity
MMSIMTLFLLLQQATIASDSGNFMVDWLGGPMFSWQFWMLITVVLLIGEVFTLGFLLGALMPGAILAAVVAAMGFGMNAQLAAFSVGVILSLLFLRPFFLRRMSDSSDSSNVEAIVGSPAKVLSAIVDGETGYVRVASEEWRARSIADHEVGDLVEVTGLDGNTLLVK